MDSTANYADIEAARKAGDADFGGLLSLLACIIVIVAICILDHTSGTKLTTFIFYGLPVFVATLRVGTTGGLFVAIIAGFAWAHANNAQFEGFEFGWALAARQLTFFFVVLCGTSLKHQRSNSLRLLEAQSYASEIEKNLLRIIGIERGRLAEEINSILKPRIDNLKELASPPPDMPLNAMSALTAVTQNVEELSSLVRDVAAGLTLTYKKGENFTQLVSRLSEAWSNSLGLEIKFRDNAQHRNMCEVEMNHLASISLEAVRRAFVSRASYVVISTADEEGIWLLSIEHNGFSYHSSSFAPPWAIVHMHAKQVGAEIQIHQVLPNGGLVICRVKK